MSVSPFLVGTNPSPEDEQDLLLGPDLTAEIEPARTQALQGVSHRAREELIKIITLIMTRKEEDGRLLEWAENEQQWKHQAVPTRVSIQTEGKKLFFKWVDFSKYF